MPSDPGADDFPLLLTEEQGHVWLGALPELWFRLRFPCIHLALRRWHSPGSEAQWQPAWCEYTENSLPSPKTTPETSPLFKHCGVERHLGKFSDHLNLQPRGRDDCHLLGESTTNPSDSQSIHELSTVYVPAES